MDLWGFLDSIHGASKNLADDIKVEELDYIPKGEEDIKFEVGRWFKIRNVVSLYADMVGSTQFSLGNEVAVKNAARVHELFTGGLVQVLKSPDFGASYLDVKGDGGFGLWCEVFGPAKAVIAGVTFKTLVENNLAPHVRQHYDRDWSLQSRIGIVKGNLLVKRIGKRSTDKQKRNWAVWVGSPVSLSSKLCSATKPDTVLVTSDIYWEINAHQELKDHLIMSCGHKRGRGREKGEPRYLWDDIEPSKVGLNKEVNRKMYQLEQRWCEYCGNKFINAVLEYIENQTS